MEITEPIESINRQLKDLYGIDTITGLPIWRVVWANDQIEKRRLETNERGVQLIRPEVREVKKYEGFTWDRYVLEQLVLVPDINAADLPSQKISYEPIWIFETQNGIYLPPRLDVCQITIDYIHAARDRGSLNKYIDPDSTSEAELLNKKERIDSIVEELRGEASQLDGAIVHGEGVGYGVKH